MQDLRTFISKLEEAKELLTIKEEVDWRFEIGDRVRKIQNSGHKGPALYFMRVKDYPAWRIFTNGLGSYSRIAIALGLGPTTPRRDIVRIFRERMIDPVAPVVNGGRPEKEDVLTGEEIDLGRVPIPWWSREDVGRYVGTWHINVTRDPVTRIRNVGIYRMQLLGRRTMTVSISPKSHLAIHLAKAERMGEPLEMAVAIGVGETLIMAASACALEGVDEYHLAGALNQKALVLTKGNLVDLEVPVSAEIIIEGRILPEKVKDGPFLDYSGVPGSDPGARKFEVSCLRLREDPIFRGAAIGIAGGEDHLLFSLLSSADCLDFHGSWIRQRIQNQLLRKSRFRAFQITGSIGNLYREHKLFNLLRPPKGQSNRTGVLAK